LQLPVPQLDRPAFVVQTPYVSRRPCGQIGHQEFRGGPVLRSFLLRTQVTSPP
jgi:hypothetical protein